MAEATFAVKIDPAQVKEAVDAQIAVAIAGVLSTNHEGLVAAIVKEAMQQQSSNSGYGARKSLFQEALNTLIRDEAKLTISTWIEENRLLIRAAMSKAIREDDKLAGRLVSQMLKGLDSGFYVSVEATVGKVASDDED